MTGLTSGLYFTDVKVENRQLKCEWNPKMIEDLKNIKSFDYPDDWVEYGKKLKREEREKKLKRIFKDE